MERNREHVVLTKSSGVSLPENRTRGYRKLRVRVQGHEELRVRPPESLGKATKAVSASAAASEIAETYIGGCAREYCGVCESPG